MTRKQLLIRALICFALAAGALLLMVRISFAGHTAGEPWPENSCGKQVLVIMEQRPDITVFWGMINMPGHPGHGQWHVQAYDALKGSWLTIDQWHTIHEHDAPEYNLSPVIKMSGEKYRELKERR